MFSTWSARVKPQACRSMWGCTATGSLVFLLYLRRTRLTVERCRLYWGPIGRPRLALRPSYSRSAAMAAFSWRLMAFTLILAHLRCSAATGSPAPAGAGSPPHLGVSAEVSTYSENCAGSIFDVA